MCQRRLSLQMLLFELDFLRDQFRVHIIELGLWQVGFKLEQLPALQIYSQPPRVDERDLSLVLEVCIRAAEKDGGVGELSPRSAVLR